MANGNGNGNGEIPADSEVVDADDSGVTTADGGGMDYADLNESITAGVSQKYTDEIRKQEFLGNDPCGFQVALQQRWDMEARHPLYRVETLAARISDKLQTAITDSYRERGEPDPDYVGGEPASLWLLDKIGAADLIPQSVLGLAAFAGWASAGANIAFVPGLLLAYVQERLPSGQQIVEGTVPVNGKGHQVSSGVFLYTSSCESNPTTQAERDECIEKGKYRGTRIAEELHEWAKYQQENVSPPNFSSARARLTNLVGSWKGTGEWGIWVPGNTVIPNSRLGSLYDIERFYKDTIAESKAECQYWRGEAGKQAWFVQYRNALLGIGALYVGWTWARRK